VTRCFLIEIFYLDLLRSFYIEKVILLYLYYRYLYQFDHNFGENSTCHVLPHPQEDDYCDRMISERDSEQASGVDVGRNHGMSIFPLQKIWG
jgi:hypothetical protein